MNCVNQSLYVNQHFMSVSAKLQVLIGNKPQKEDILTC